MKISFRIVGPRLVYAVEASPTEMVAWLRTRGLGEEFDLVWSRSDLKRFQIKRSFDSVEDRLVYADSQEKIDLLDRLEEAGVVRQECPVSHNYRDVSYWPYTVLKPAALPELLRSEYERLGEIRW